MTRRYPIRSGTHSVPRGGVHGGLTLWEVTLAQLLSAQGYATGIWGKWHLGRAEARLPTNRGFDEWYGIPRTYSEAFWPALNDTNSVWPSVGSIQGWDPKMVPAQPIYEARKGEMPRKVGELNLDQRLSMKKEITRYLLHQEERERGQAVFRLYTILVNSSAGIAAGNSGDAAFKIYVASVQSVV